MLQLLKEKQIEEGWNKLVLMITAAIPESEADTMPFVKKACLSGKLQVWVLLRDGKFVGCVLTTVVLQVVAQTATYLVYGAFGLDHVKPQEYRQCLETLITAARFHKCTGISFYTNNHKLSNWAARAGALLSTYAFFPVQLIEDGSDEEDAKKND